MKLKFIAACVAACAAPAFAAPLTGPYDTPELTVYLTGASAPDNSLASIAGGLFNGVQGTNWFAFIDNAGGTSQRAFFGEIKQSATNDVPASLVGKKVLLIKRSAGGSVFGVNPIARSEALQVLKVSAATCADTTIAGYNKQCALVGNDPGIGTQTGDEMVPDLGVSDVSPAMFKAPYNVEFGKTQLSPTEVSTLTIKGVNGVAMGVAVTNAIPDTTYLSRAAIGGIVSGLVTDWTQIDPALAPAAGNQVVVCRRVPGSGTQASFNWFFNNFPCTTSSIAGSGQTTPARMADSASGVVSGSGTSADPYVIDPTQGYTVIENPGSGDVANCLTKAAAGGKHTFKDEQGKSYSVDFGTTGGYGAVGVLSVDSLDKTSNAANKWSYRALDGAGMYFDADTVANSYTPTTTGTGVHPTKENLLEGKYEMVAEVTMQYRSTLSGLKKTFADLFIKRAGAPANNTKPWVVALPIDYDPTLAANSANTTKVTRNGNMCAPAQKLY